MPPTLARHQPHPRCTRQRATHASTLLMLHALPRHPPQHTTHASTLLTLARQHRKHATHAIHASTKSTLFLKLFTKRYILEFLQSSEYVSVIARTYLKIFHYQSNTNSVWQVFFENLDKALEYICDGSQYCKIKDTNDNFPKRPQKVLKSLYHQFRFQ